MNHSVHSFIDIQHSLYIYSFLMDISEKIVGTTTVIPAAPRTNTRKKSSSKQDDTEKITEKNEGGIIVRRYKGRKVDVEKGDT